VRAEAANERALEWDHNVVAVHSVEELDALLDRLTTEAKADLPFMVTLGLEDDSSLSIGLGRPETVLSYISPGVGPPHFMSRGEPRDDSPPKFLFSGEMTEYPPWSAVPTETAREALRDFFETGELPKRIAWEEI
jgi:Immunity protein Imm1